MIKKIKSSLFFKVFFITAAMVLCVSLMIYGLLAWLMPQTYSSRLNTALDERARGFIIELEQVAFSDSGGLFDQFLQNTEIYSVELYDGHGLWVQLPTEQKICGEGIIEQTAVGGSYERSPVLSNSYYFSFADSSVRYMLIVCGTAEQVAELRQTFLRIFPLLLLVVLVFSFGVSWLYSHIITKPILELSHVSEQMSRFELEWQIRVNRTDELGILEQSLNLLSHNLSAALSDLQEANKKLEKDIEAEKELEQARTDFFSAVSHELKTPVTILKGQIEGMLLGIGVYKDHKKYLARALETANTLETMVQEILTISRLDAADAGLKKEDFDCVPIIRRYLYELEDVIIKKDLQICLDLPSEVFMNGNKMLMEKVFSNLIGNAVKYSPQNASIGVYGHIERGCLEFSIENTGTYIPDESIPKLFDAFYRVEQSRNRKTGGSGLGLYVTQRILHRHGSECMVCNTSRGVRFSFAISM